uniref:Metalloendopeptidase n=1 Tax=Macrostomum lignano TaxID=282301 RepID=A0A1I8GAU2_9PLAT
MKLPASSKAAKNSAMQWPTLLIVAATCCVGLQALPTGGYPPIKDTLLRNSMGQIEKTPYGTEYLVIDDMVFPRSPPPSSRGQADRASSDTLDPNYNLNMKFWPGGIIFYLIDPSFSFDYSKKILEAMKIIQENVGEEHLEFKAAQTSSGEICRKGYMHIINDVNKLCRAEVGMQPTFTRVWLHEDSCPFGTIQHEILHALGRYHEQCRPDRDKYVTLLPQNIAASECSNYYITMDGPDPSLKLTYDSASIMHYGSCHFSCNGAYTMIKKSDGSKIVANRQSMTKLDVDKMRALYPKEFKVPYYMGMCSGNTRKGKKMSARKVAGLSKRSTLSFLAFLSFLAHRYPLL